MVARCAMTKDFLTGCEWATPLPQPQFSSCFHVSCRRAERIKVCCPHPNPSSSLGHFWSTSTPKTTTDALQTSCPSSCLHNQQQDSLPRHSQILSPRGPSVRLKSMQKTKALAAGHIKCTGKMGISSPSLTKLPPKPMFGAISSSKENRKKNIKTNRWLKETPCKRRLVY